MLLPLRPHPQGCSQTQGKVTAARGQLQVVLAGQSVVPGPPHLPPAAAPSSPELVTTLLIASSESAISLRDQTNQHQQASGALPGWGWAQAGAWWAGITLRGLSGARPKARRTWPIRCWRADSLVLEGQGERAMSEVGSGDAPQGHSAGMPGKYSIERNRGSSSGGMSCGPKHPLSQMFSKGAVPKAVSVITQGS